MNILVCEAILARELSAGVYGDADLLKRGSVRYNPEKYKVRACPTMGLALPFRLYVSRENVVEERGGIAEIR